MAPDRWLSDRWAHLLDGLLESIVSRLCFEDLIRFSCVCRSWKSFITTKSSSYMLSPKPHLSLIIYPLSTLSLYNLYNYRTYKIQTPQLRLHRICGSCLGGWLITTHEDGSIQAFHPFTKTLIRLPNVAKFPGIEVTKFEDEDEGDDAEEEDDHNEDKNDVEYMCYNYPPDSGGHECMYWSPFMYDFFLYKVILSSDTSIAMAIYGISRRLGFCRIGKDETWVALNVPGKDISGFQDVIFHRGRFFAVRSSGAVFAVVGLDTDSPSIKAIVGCPQSYEEDIEYDDSTDYYTKYYLVVSLRKEFMLITRFRFIPSEQEFAHQDYKTLAFRVAKLDLKKGEWVRVKDFGNDSSVFVGGNYSFCISNSDIPNHYNKKRNYIFFTDDYMEGLVERRSCGYDVGAFDLTNGAFQRWSSVNCVQFPPVWFTTMLT